MTARVLAAARAAPLGHLVAPTRVKCVSQPLQGRMEFLRQDLVHLFDEQGIDKDSYEEVVEFVDPITSYRRLSGGI